MTEPIVFPLRGEFIALNSLLKAAGWADSGAEASHWISEGKVLVDGKIETRKACKIRSGQSVEYQGRVIRVEIENQKNV